MMKTTELLQSERVSCCRLKIFFAVRYWLTAQTAIYVAFKLESFVSYGYLSCPWTRNVSFWQPSVYIVDSISLQQHSTNYKSNNLIQNPHNCSVVYVLVKYVAFESRV